MQRETKTIKTPVGGIEVVINAYVTGREKRLISNVFLQKGKADAELYNEAQDAALRAIIVSVGGKTEGIVDAVLDMRHSDSKFVIDAVNEVSSDRLNDEKKA